MRKISFWEWGILATLLCVLFYFYLGFWYPDPFLYERMNPLKKIILIGALRFILPALIVGLPLLYVKARVGQIKPENVFLTVGSLILAFLLGYPFVNYFYHNSFNQRKEIYHPHLQIMPTNLEVGAISQMNETIDVVCLGGSTTEFKDSEGLGWPERVQRDLQGEHANSTIQFHNQGKRWYTSLHSLINYQTNLRKFHPEIIVVMHSINDLLASADFSYFSHQSFRDDYGHFYGPLNRFLSHDDFIPDILNTVGQLWNHQPRQVLNDSTFKGLKAFEQNLNTIIDLAKLDGTKVILLTQPTLYKANANGEERAAMFMLNFEYVGEGKKWSLETVVRGISTYNNKVRQIAKERNVYLIDLEASIPKTLEYFYDDCHYTEKGFNLVSETVSAGFNNSGIINQFPSN